MERGWDLNDHPSRRLRMLFADVVDGDVVGGDEGCMRGCVRGYVTLYKGGNNMY